MPKAIHKPGKSQAPNAKREPAAEVSAQKDELPIIAPMPISIHTYIYIHTHRHIYIYTFMNYVYIYTYIEQFRCRAKARLQERQRHLRAQRAAEERRQKEAQELW